MAAVMEETKMDALLKICRAMDKLPDANQQYLVGLADGMSMMAAKRRVILMPRVKINESAYKAADFTKAIKKRMIDLDMNQEELADRVGTTPQNMSYKLRNNSYTFIDFIEIVKALEFKDAMILEAVGRRNA